jgi:hypothetical protein
MRAERAVQELRRAEKLERRPAYDGTDARFKAREAQSAREDGERLLAAPERLTGDADTEVVPSVEPFENPSNGRLHIVSTLADPTSINIDASEHRVAVASRAGVLSAALDTAQTANAKNSVEKMLCHQMAAVHLAGMELLARIQESPTLQVSESVDLVRLTNAAARLFEVFQSGCLTLQKLKTGGRQHVVVQHQHVNVGSGGQAVVAGRLGPGSRTRRRASKNER